ncbi:hypothetical protein [Lysobacter sp. CA199]|uniref:hypothetical protein n=1 Tax=Lysobacter sp. CA199 TaxID=3455608 RepID=UPI003F8D7663
MNRTRIAAAVLVVVLSACKASAPAEPAAAAAAVPAPAVDAAPSQPTPDASQLAPQGGKPGFETAPRPQLAEGACAKTEDGFGAFLEQFISEPELRAAYSAPQIEVRDIKHPDKLIAAHTPQQADPFRIALVDYQWSYDEPGKDAGQLSRIKLDRKLSGDSMRLDFVKAEFSPDEDVVKTFGSPEAYVFQFKRDCWQLAQHLR